MGAIPERQRDEMSSRIGSQFSVTHRRFGLYQHQDAGNRVDAARTVERSSNIHRVFASSSKKTVTNKQCAQAWQLITQIFRIIHVENVTLRRRKLRQIHDFSH